jgi:hypothetical protein
MTYLKNKINVNIQNNTFVYTQQLLKNTSGVMQSNYRIAQNMSLKPILP